MLPNEMKIGVRYVVTKRSKDGTFWVGDHIRINGDRTISCREAGGWVEEAFVPETYIGLEVELDNEWVLRRKERLLKELAYLTEKE